MGRQVEYTDRRSRIVRFAGEDDLGSVWRPVGIELLALIVEKDLAGGSTLDRNRVDPPGLGSDTELEEQDLLAVRRPARKDGRHGRKSELQGVGPVQFASPHRAVTKRDVGDPLAVFRKFQVNRTHATEKRNEAL